MARVFLASYDDIDQWGRRSDALLKTLEKDDTIFLIKNNKELNTAKENMIANMKKAANVKISDIENGNAAVTGKKLLHEYLEKQNEKHSVYIIGPSMQCIFHDKGALAPLAKEIMYHHCFQVKKLKAVEESSYIEMTLADIMNGGGIEPNESANEKPTQSTSPKKDKQHQQPEKHKNETYFQDNSNKIAVEKQIFGNSVDRKEYKEPHNTLQNAKAFLISQLLLRLRKHIKKLLFAQKETAVLTDKQLLAFIMIVLKVNSADDFNESWSSSESDPVINMKQHIFTQIKEEVVYYDKVADLLYEEDQWEL